MADYLVHPDPSLMPVAPPPSHDAAAATHPLHEPIVAHPFPLASPVGGPLAPKGAALDAFGHYADPSPSPFSHAYEPELGVPGAALPPLGESNQVTSHLGPFDLLGILSGEYASSQAAAPGMLGWEDPSHGSFGAGAEAGVDLGAGTLHGGPTVHLPIGDEPWWEAIAKFDVAF